MQSGLRLNWTQKTKYLWEAQFEEFFLEVTQTIPERPSKFQWVYTITNNKYNIEYGSEHRGMRYLTPEETKQHCEEKLFSLIKFYRDEFQRMLDELSY